MILNEYSATTINKKTSKMRKARAKHQPIVPLFIGVTRDGFLKFRTSSGSVKGKYYYETLAFVDPDLAFEEMMDLPIDTPISEIIKAEDILVDCTCPDYQFRFANRAFKKGWGIYKADPYEPAPGAKRRKVKPAWGMGCKHLVAIYNNLDKYSADIEEELYKAGFLK